MTATIVFIAGAVVINVLIYGGIATVYFADKHRGASPPRGVEASRPGTSLVAQRVGRVGARGAHAR
jgi:hypothetical protein